MGLSRLQSLDRYYGSRIVNVTMKLSVAFPHINKRSTLYQSLPLEIYVLFDRQTFETIRPMKSQRP